MRFRDALRSAVVLAGLVLCAPPLPALADQPRDWMLSASKPGTYANLDAIFGAFQGSVEHRINIYGNANQLTLRASALAAIPFGVAQVDADVRVVLLTVGVSGGVMDVWRNQTFSADEALSRKERREREAAGDMNNMGFGFAEVRASLAIPFNDYLVFNAINGFRVTGADKRSFDNLIGVVHDGNYLRSDIQLFFKHKAVGGFAPMAQILNFPLEGERHTQVNYGFAYVSRAGLVRRNDLILFQLLYHPGGDLGGYDNKNVYGLATLRSPVTFTLAYRSIIDL
jgi:hypothetical protein